MGSLYNIFFSEGFKALLTAAFLKHKHFKLILVLVWDEFLRVINPSRYY